jgi:hypothetical protein
MNQSLAIPVSLIVLLVVGLVALAASNSGVQSFTSGTDRVATDARCSSQVEDVCSSQGQDYASAVSELDDVCAQSLNERESEGRCPAAADSTGAESLANPYMF